MKINLSFATLIPATIPISLRTFFSSKEEDKILIFFLFPKIMLLSITKKTVAGSSFNLIILSICGRLSLNLNNRTPLFEDIIISFSFIFNDSSVFIGGIFELI